MSSLTQYSLRIDRSRLPPNDEDAFEFLVEYFNGFHVDYDAELNFWNVSLKQEDFTYCENMEKGFDTLNITAAQCNDFCIENSVNCLCLSETWIPYAWSQFLTKKNVCNQLTIIHIDDHSDLMSPFIVQSNDQYFDMFTKENVCFHTPQMMKKAIKSGAIYIGSMLTPIALSVPTTRVLHLKQNVSTSLSVMKYSPYTDNMLSRGGQRIAISFCKTHNTEEPSLYLQTSDPALLPQYILPDSTVLLHIDMDYFNNRYNGSSSWQTERLGLDLPFFKQTVLMDSICDVIGAINMMVPISCTYIGMSPSFYPSEFWGCGLRYMLASLDSKGINVHFLLEKLHHLF